MASATKRASGQDDGPSDDNSSFGSPRGNLREVQFYISPQLSDALTARADHEDLVLAEVVMAAVRDLPRDEHPGVPLRQRRRGMSVRRAAVVRPNEADQVHDIATELGITTSALIRSALERYLAG